MGERGRCNSQEAGLTLASGKPGICPLPPGGQRARQLALGKLGALDLAKGTQLVRGLLGLLRSHGPGRKGQQRGELFKH